MENGEEFTNQFVARPGHSEHQTGLAIDLGLKQPDIDFLRPYFPYKGICQTFRELSTDYGFIERYPAGKEAITGIAHEPWHFRYVGVLLLPTQFNHYAAPFLTFRRSGSVPAVRKEKRMYFDAKEFGKRLHDVRTSRGITQEELAVRLGLASKQHVSRMENGERSCSIDLLIELSCILHVSTDYLLMGSEPSKEEVKNDLLSIISELSTIAKKI